MSRPLLPRVLRLKDFMLVLHANLQSKAIVLLHSYLHDAIFPACYKEFVVSTEVATVRFVLEPRELPLYLSGCGVVNEHLCRNVW